MKKFIVIVPIIQDEPSILYYMTEEEIILKWERDKRFFEESYIIDGSVKKIQSKKLVDV